MQLLLKWMDGLARHPTGADDVTPVPGVLPPVQKLVLQILGHFNTVRPAAEELFSVTPHECWFDCHLDTVFKGR